MPYNENSIRVIGEVENNLVTTYRGDLSINDYIDFGAGGYKRYADKRNIYLIKANGISEKLDIGVFLIRLGSIGSCRYYSSS